MIGTALLALGMVYTGCTGDRQAPEEADMAESRAESAMQLPNSFVYIQHDVEDFDAWLPVYEGFEDEREAAGVVALWVYRDLDQPSRVHALHGASDVETLRAFTRMEELATAMGEAGVVGQPRFDFMNLVPETAPDSMIVSRYNVLVAHEIADWDAWKAVFDGHEGARLAAGLVSRGIARGADNPNMVYMNFAVSNLDSARSFAASEDLRTAMESAGVVGEPEIYFTETVQSM